MPALKIHLSDEEFQPILRKAKELAVKPEDIAYAGLHWIMVNSGASQSQTLIHDAKTGRSENLPPWADSARSVHAYEGKADDLPRSAREH